MPLDTPVRVARFVEQGCLNGNEVTTHHRPKTSRKLLMTNELKNRRMGNETSNASAADSNNRQRRREVITLLMCQTNVSDDKAGLKIDHSDMLPRIEAVLPDS